jgi:hypothetical protein
VLADIGPRQGQHFCGGCNASWRAPDAGQPRRAFSPNISAQPLAGERTRRRARPGNASPSGHDQRGGNATLAAVQLTRPLLRLPKLAFRAHASPTSHQRPRSGRDATTGNGGEVHRHQRGAPLTATMFGWRMMQGLLLVIKNGGVGASSTFGEAGMVNTAQPLATTGRRRRLPIRHDGKLMTETTTRRRGTVAGKKALALSPAATARRRGRNARGQLVCLAPGCLALYALTRLMIDMPISAVATATTGHCWISHDCLGNDEDARGTYTPWRLDDRNGLLAAKLSSNAIRSSTATCSLVRRYASLIGVGWRRCERRFPFNRRSRCVQFELLLQLLRFRLLCRWTSISTRSTLLSA